MKIALAQHNPVVGDVAGNLQQVLRLAADAQAGGAALVAFPEQALLGYPAKDLLLRSEVVAANQTALRRLADQTPLPTIVGFAEPNPEPRGRPLCNSAALVHAGQIHQVWRKRLLPTYDVFDEQRYFAAAGPQPLLAFGGRRIGVTICEDLLSEDLAGRALYDADPAAELVAAGAELLLNISASPYTLGKLAWRQERFAALARRHGVPVLHVNQVGGNDELLFDGNSLVLASDGTLCGRAHPFEPDLLLVDLDDLAATRNDPPLERIESLRRALVMGVRDYVHKCGFQQVVVGLSGGIDSSLVATLAVAAFGADNVRGVAMPSRFSTGHSVEDARRLADNLRIACDIVPIEAAHGAFEQTLAPLFADREPDVTEENLQARIRGMILMSISNKFGCLLLTTGNKSEVAVGYTTLYGDMCGGLAVISDVPKTMVYELCRHLNARAGRDVIPERVLTKPPSAELRLDQYDQQSLPPYEVLDDIIERYEHAMQTPAQIVAAGHEPHVVADVLRKLHISEYKRQQAAPGLKVTSRAFGFGRRMPIAARQVAHEPPEDRDRYGL